ncbi:MAG: (uracil-5)-methyltransferase [Rhodospirillales bacterium 20-64-7]|nr:MAG: (uracil-5)-methyltransferase [Rhodospirillales bacterium 20-64-7]
MSHCIHFGACGGCAVAGRSAVEKSASLRAALQRARFVDVTVAALVETPLQTRRRVDLAVKRYAGVITLGLHRARSDEIIDMAECVLLAPRIVALLPDFRILLRSIEALRRTGTVIINWLDTGPDILLRLDGDLTGPDRTKLIAFARAHHAVRISVTKGAAEAELVVMLSSPVITLSGIAVEPPPGAFLQASAAGEAAIVKAVIAGLPKLTARSRIVELYAGIGTLSFALVPHGRVEAYEGAADAVAAHELALRKANLAGRMSVAIRDLTRRPLMVAEMAKAAAVVLDPPYAGAGPQMKNLVAAAVPRVIYVSCNPDALATDAFSLKRAGYEILSATPIDQFPYSENLESVVVFAKP